MSTSAVDTGELPLPAMSNQASGSWFILRLQLTPSNCLIAIPNFEFENWGPEDKFAILAAFSNMTGAHGIYVRDYAQPRTFLGPVQFFVLYADDGVALLLPPPVSDLSALPPFPDQIIMTNNIVAPADNDTEPTSDNTPYLRVPRPPNAFILYRKHHHASIVAQNPSVHNNKISQIIGKMWSEETDEVTNYFKAQADQAKVEHAIKYPNYQYQPRKPSEKKRRMTKKKAATLAANATEAMTSSHNYSESSGADLTQSSLPLNRKTKNRVVKQTKTANNIAAIAQAIETRFDIAENVNVRVVNNLASDSFELPDVIGVNDFDTAVNANGFDTTQFDNIGYSGRAGSSDNINTLFFPANDEVLSRDRADGWLLFAQSQGWI
uniref:MAT1-2-1 n=1 Tax=Hymenoscyphus albidus TaxID=595503 RepID=K4H1X4_9HELO|nr:MAT1-2-1 [Hymenoscyphus albidus]